LFFAAEATTYMAELRRSPRGAAARSQTARKGQKLSYELVTQRRKQAAANLALTG
jgi:cold shock CspA family protein